MPIRRNLLLYWPLAIAGAFLVSTLALNWGLQASQEELRKASEMQAVQAGRVQASHIASFLRDRRREAANLAGSHEIESYFVNRALGMSPRYGLNANLAFIEQALRETVDTAKLSGRPIYARIAFLDEAGTSLAAAGEARARISGIDAPSQLLIDTEHKRVLVHAPVLFKGKPSGTIIAEFSLDWLAQVLGSDADIRSSIRQHKELLLASGVAVAHSSQATAAFDAAQRKRLAGLPADVLVSASTLARDGVLDGMLVLRTPIEGTPLSILTLRTADDIYGQSGSSSSGNWLSAFSAALFVLAFGFERMRQRTSRLENDILLSNRHRAELAAKNGELRAEIARREAVEMALEGKSAALDRMNADLRIAATAFDCQEGMVVSDAGFQILRVNQALVATTGHAAADLVGKSLRDLVQFDAQPSAGAAGPWPTFAATGTWQGEVELATKSGATSTRWLMVSTVRDEEGAISHCIGTFYDISERKQAEQRIRELAFYDQLTGLPNRPLLLDRARQAMHASKRDGHYGALLFIDLDNFKTLNDTLGHQIGDLLLRQTAERLSLSVRAEDTVARFGGDEFVVLLGNLGTSVEDKAVLRAEAVANAILKSFEPAYRLAGYEHSCTPSIGITLFSAGRDTVEELLKRADLAMYEAKAAGRNTLRFFDPQMQTVISNRAALEADLSDDIRKSNFLLHYQPQVDGEGRLIGAEVLLRWPHGGRGMIPPSVFIPLAESTGLILPLGNWMFETACRQIAAWSALAEMSTLSFAVNISPAQLRHRHFVRQVLETIERTDVNPLRLKFELTESLLVRNMEEAIEKMAELRAHGIRFSLDDFGTGYSSLAYLKRLPLDQLKIDQSFVRDILTDANDAAIAKMVIALGETLGLAVIAEGVETEPQRQFLADQGCHAYQGYLFGRPMPASAFETLARTLQGAAARSSRDGGVAHHPAQLPARLSA